MNPESLFGAALGIVPPWKVESIELSKETKRLDIKINFHRGLRFLARSVAPLHLSTTRLRRLGGI